MKISKMILFLLTGFIFLVLIPNILAEIDMQLNINKEFNQGETISFNYSIRYDYNSNITFIPYIDCPSAPTAQRIERTTELKAGEILEKTFIGIAITEDIEPQTCTAYVKILSPVQHISSKNFSIVTNPSFIFNVILSKKVFTKGEDIKLDYFSEIKNPSIKAVLKYPDKKSEEIKLPGTIKASQIGTYELEVTATKEGYKTQSVKEQFGVIEKHAQIKEGLIFPKEKRFDFIFWSIIIVLIVSMIIVLYFLLKSKKRI